MMLACSVLNEQYITLFACEEKQHGPKPWDAA